MQEWIHASWAILRRRQRLRVQQCQLQPDYELWVLTMINNTLSACHADCYHSYRRTYIVSMAMILLLACSLFLHGATLSVEHVANLDYDFSDMRVPEWSGGALVNFASNRTASPVLLSFDEQGKQIQSIAIKVPGAEMIDLDDIARGPDGSLAVCGAAFDHSGRGSGFIALANVRGDQLTVVRLYPYQPRRITIASDGTFWTAGVELANAVEDGPDVNPSLTFAVRGDRGR